MVLVLVLLVAGTLRLVNLRQSPPGLNQDEAANAWNAYCLLKTGRDQAGVRWPIFYSRCLGENRSTLFMYWTIPFQAVGGLNVWTTRLPSAVGGVLTVLLLYYVGSRMFGRACGVVAAALLAVNPWHIQQSRWGHEAAICPLLVTGTLAALLWANLPLDDDDRRRPRPLVTALAGAVAGVSCYGYPAIRLFLPVFLVAVVLVTWRSWWQRLQTRAGGLAIAACLVTSVSTFGPLAWKHLTDGEHMNKRFRDTRVWQTEDPLANKIVSVLARYPGHFGPDFLFISGDHFDIQSPPKSGEFDWYMAPLMMLGMAATLSHLRSSRAARVLLVWIVLYPIGDCFSEHISMHALRSLPGVSGLVLLGAVGAVWAARWLYQRHRTTAWVSAGLFAGLAIACNARFLSAFFGEYNRDPSIYRQYHVDLLEAAEWLRPRLRDVDAVFCTTDGINMAYLITLVGLRYEPQQWFADDRDVFGLGEWEHYRRYGKMHFWYDDSDQAAVNELAANGRRDRVIFIVRPGETALDQPIKQIVRPDGQTALLIYERYL